LTIQSPEFISSGIMKLVIIALLICSLVICTRYPGDPYMKKWSGIIRQHLARYPSMQPADMYKLVYQGTMGPAHLGANLQEIQKYLDKELFAVEAAGNCELIENISPDSEYVRINLKKYKALGYSSEIIVQSVVESCRQQSVNRVKLKNVWDYISRQVSAGQIPVDMADFLEFQQYILENNYPVVHHSEQYRHHYSPAYRVVLKSVWENEHRKMAQ